MKSTVKHQWLKKAIIGMIGRPRAREFEQASRDVKGTQEALLRKVIADCRDTAFGKDHGFANIRTTDDYRKAVPIRDFEGHRKYIDRMTHGEADILFPGRPIFYNTTSGTSNKPKEIPVSTEYFTKAYTKISRLWLYSCLRDNPRLFSGKNLSAVGAAEEGQVADGTPCGALSGAVYRHIPGVLRDVYSAPYPIFCIKDYDKKYYAMLRFAIGANINDIIEVTGHYNQIPLFRFIRKGDGFTSLTGEKLTETQVLEWIGRASSRSWPCRTSRCAATKPSCATSCSSNFRPRPRRSAGPGSWMRSTGCSKGSTRSTRPSAAASGWPLPLSTSCRRTRTS